MSAFIDFANSMSARWAEGMWLILWQSAIFGVLIGLAVLALRRARASVRCWVWMLVPLKLLIVPLLIISLPVLPAVPVAHTSAFHAQSPAATEGVPMSQPATVPATMGTSEPTTPGARPAPTDAESSWRHVRNVNVFTWLMLAWLAGVAFHLLRLGLGWRRMTRLTSDAKPATDAMILAAAREAAALVGLARPPRILMSEREISPCVFGIVRPVVLLPTSLAQAAGPAELSGVLAHEFAHIRRYDPQCGLVLSLCESLFFFHPLVRLARRQVVRERERACDEFVVAEDRMSRTAYARALVSATEICCLPQKQPSPEIVAESFGQLRDRLKRLAAHSAQGPTSRLRRSLGAAAILLCLLALPGVVLTARAAPQEPAPDKSAVAVDSIAYEGIVTDKAGKPVPNVIVRSHVLRRDNPLLYNTNEASAVTKEDGRFAIGPVPVLDVKKGIRQLVFEHPDYAIGWYSQAPSRDTDLKGLAITLFPPQPVAGVVRDRQARPIGGVMVEAHMQLVVGRDRHYFSLHRYNKLAVKTDARGRFRFNKIPEGAQLNLAFRHPQYVTHSTLDRSQPGAYAIRTGDEETEITLQRGATITGRLVRDRKPFEKPGIRIGAEGPDHSRGSDTTDKAGHFEITGLRGGKHMVSARQEPVADLDLVIEPQRDVSAKVGAPPTNIDLAVSSGYVIRGRIHDKKTDAPIPAQRIWCSFSGTSRAPSFTAATDEQGRFVLRVAAGDWLLQTGGWSGGRSRNFRKELRVRAGAELEEIDWAISVRPMIRGQLVDGDGKPVAGQVTLGFPPAIKTDANGEFAMPEPPVSHGNTPRVGLAFDQDMNRGRGFFYQRGKTKLPLRLILEPVATVIGRIVDPRGKAATGIKPTLTIRLPNQMYQGPAKPPWKITVEPDGRIRFHPVPIGLPMHITVYKPGFQVSRDVEGLEPGRVTDLGKVALRALTKTPLGPLNAVIAGVLVDENKKPVVAARVRTYIAGITSKDVTDRKGRFRLTGLPAKREIRLGTSWPGYGHCRMEKVETGREDVVFQILPQGYEWFGKPPPVLQVEKWINSEPMDLNQLKGKVGAHQQRGVWSLPAYAKHMNP